MPDPRKLVTPLLEGLLKPMKRLDETFQPIKTYHASPHDFDTVDLSKVGTGQGATMYGHGFYSAQSPEVSGPGGVYWREFYDKRFGDFIPHNETFNRDIEQIATDVLKQHKFDRASAAAQMRKHADAIIANNPTASNRPHVDKLLRGADLLESGAQVGPRVYETHLYARPEDYLDWDKPFSQQSQHVRSALESMPRKTASDLYGLPDPGGMINWSGEDIYKKMAEFGGFQSGSKALGKRVATEGLADVGIPGVRYLDQMSRGTYFHQARLKDIDLSIDSLHGQLMDPRNGPKDAEMISRQIGQLERERDMLTERVNKATYNYVTGNTDIIDLAKKFAVPGALAPAALPYLSNQPMETRY